MTATVVLDMIEESFCALASFKSVIKIVENAVNLVGTTARLLTGDSLTVEELMYAMMLPSGNDAALSLALYFGCLLLHKGKVEPNRWLSEISEQTIQERIETEKLQIPLIGLDKETEQQKLKRLKKEYDIRQDS